MSNILAVMGYNGEISFTNRVSAIYLKSLRHTPTNTPQLTHPILLGSYNYCHYTHCSIVTTPAVPHPTVTVSAVQPIQVRRLWLPTLVIFTRTQHIAHNHILGIRALITFPQAGCGCGWNVFHHITLGHTNNCTFLIQPLPYR